MTQNQVDISENTPPLLNFKGYVGDVKESFKDAFKIAASYPKRFSEKSTLGKAISLLKLGVVGASLPLSMAAGVGLTASLVGTTALAGTFLVMRLPKNKGINALQPFVASAVTAQKLVLGAYGYAVMAGIAAVRTATMAMLPDDEKYMPLRKKVGYGFAAVGIFAVGATGLFISPWNFLPMASMLMGTAASTMTSTNSHKARALYFIANLNNAFYSGVYSDSVAAVAIDGTAALNITTAAKENGDFPARIQNGEKQSLRKRTGQYLRSLFSKSADIPVDEAGKQPANENKEGAILPANQNMQGSSIDAPEATRKRPTQTGTMKGP